MGLPTDVLSEEFKRNSGCFSSRKFAQSVVAATETCSPAISAKIQLRQSRKKCPGEGVLVAQKRRPDACLLTENSHLLDPLFAPGAAFGRFFLESILIKVFNRLLMNAARVRG
jgi:hypothetical protein